MNESFIINKYLKPLSKNFKEALNLSDDAAILKTLKNKNLVVSVDNFSNFLLVLINSRNNIF